MYISGSLLVLSSFTLFAFATTDLEERYSTHSSNNRSNWSPGFNIHTDYDEKTPQGRLRKYELVVTQEWIAPDGYLTYGTVFNGQYPGPSIEANWGDTLRITVINNLTNYNGTSVHWHGIRQFQTNHLDGVVGITQCPIKPGSSQVYEFQVSQYGASWYHSHFSLQYANGLVGPLMINGPSIANYDVDLGPWLLSDWYHADAFSLYHMELDTVRNLAPLPDSVILNGKGVYDCNPTTDPRCTGKAAYYEVLVKEGNTYRIAVQNTGTLLTLTFFIDGHNFTVIQNDFVPIEPYTTNVLNVGIGQRYIILVEANASFEHGTNFWIHAHYCALATFFPTSRVGIIRYDKHNISDPYDPPASELNQNFGCNDPDPKDLVPVVKRTVGNRANKQDEADYLKIGLEFWPNASDPDSHIHKWVLQNTPLYLDWEEPSLKKLALDKNSSFPAETVPYFLDFETGEWVYFVITNNYSVETVSPPRQAVQSVHPIHLHGHDLYVLAQGEGPFTTDIVPNLDNPSRRDVTDVPIGGYVWIAFKVDNPGAWLIHCHIAWHASDGLALQYIEQPKKIKGLLQEAGVLPEFKQRCEEWTEWYTGVNEKKDALQDDSGI